MLQQGERYYKYRTIQSYHATSGNVGHTPVHGGMYITPSSGAALEEGTLGGIVTLAGKPYIIGAGHTFMAKGKTLRVGRGKLTVVGTVTHWVNRLGYPDFADASLARPSVPVSFDIPSIGIPKGHTPAKVGMRVRMYGATSGLKTGTILGIDEAVEGRRAISVSIPWQSGDSGAFLVNDQNLVVAMVAVRAEIANAETKKIIKINYLATPVEGIIMAYPGINFAGKAGTFQPTATITGLPTSPLPNTTPPAIPTPTPSPSTGGGGTTTPDDPIGALIQIILAFIEDSIGSPRC